MRGWVMLLPAAALLIGAADDAALTPFGLGQMIGTGIILVLGVLVVIALIGDAREKAEKRKCDQAERRTEKTDD